jgi:DNA-binding NarL/FixJ family response regulator
MQVHVIDSHAIYRRGLCAALAALPCISDVCDAASLPEAAADPLLPGSRVAILDRDLDDLFAGIREIRRIADVAVVVCSGRRDDADILEVIGAGAVGYLLKETLTPETLEAGVRSVAAGSGVIEPDLLGRILRDLARVSEEVLEPRGLSLTLLSQREREVLRLVSEGHPTREVAERLCYSERTIKNVLHDVATKLGARSRSQAVAHAVREGLI